MFFQSRNMLLVNLKPTLEYNLRSVYCKGEEVITIPEEVQKNMRSGHRLCYRLVQAMWAGALPTALKQLIKCGPTCHAGWSAAGQRIVLMCSREHGLRSKHIQGSGQILCRILLQALLQDECKTLVWVHHTTFPTSPFSLQSEISDGIQ